MDFCYSPVLEKSFSYQSEDLSEIGIPENYNTSLKLYTTVYGVSSYDVFSRQLHFVASKSIYP
jgi:hypothetical protein